MPFDEILGQDRVVRVLKAGLSSGKLHHAYLYYGPCGVGRFKTAGMLAKALLCQNPAGEHDPCGTCADCVRVDAENHPDFRVERPLDKGESDEWEVDPERGEIRIDQVREVEKWLIVRSFHGGWRVCVFDGAEKINRAAANALLKTLEEPPPKSLIVLISTTRTRLPATVQSRCQALYFPPLPKQEIERVLAGRAQGSRDELARVASLSEGSIGRALGLDREWLFAERVAWFRRIAGFFSGRTRESLVEFIEELAGSERLMEVLDLLAAWYRDLVVYRGTGERQRILQSDLSDLMTAYEGEDDIASLVEKMRAVRQAREDIERARLNSRLVLEALFLRLSGDSYKADSHGIAP